MKCLIIQPIHQAGLERLRQSGITPVICPAPDMETVARHVPDCDAAITRDAGFDAGAFAAADKLRVVAVHGAGHDPVDKQAAAKAGVLITNTPGTNARSVAELALGLALGVARRIPAADGAMRLGQAGFRESASFRELSDGTALIVGWGATGSSLGGMLHDAFGMRVLAHTPRRPAEQWVTHAPDLHTALAEADLISLNAPLRPETRNLIDASAFTAMKPGAILINVARAGLIDEPALQDALTAGKLGGAGLDMVSAHAAQGLLATFPNVIFTPHIGGTTEAALRRTAEAAASQVIEALSGRLPTMTINPEVWRNKV
ncbi:3-phosphoglycerate dehydrogenase [Pseudohalocynthiibacter aestuariivivens]|nr:NAD(P)-dependent oxidoreductase [Pseudohalocynthiibacter aestuariivivens]QIE45297.1 3-phosphoglycerate dehydrogenase [Pseudohalocynthiibacter aestuariivivens]